MVQLADPSDIHGEVRGLSNSQTEDPHEDPLSRVHDIPKCHETAAMMQQKFEIPESENEADGQVIEEIPQGKGDDSGTEWIDLDFEIDSDVVDVVKGDNGADEAVENGDNARAQVVAILFFSFERDEEMCGEVEGHPHEENAECLFEKPGSAEIFLVDELGYWHGLFYNICLTSGFK